MDKEKTVNNYFEFLAGVVSDDRFGKNVTYRRLLMHLHTIEFRWTIKDDSNRANDGVSMRWRFAQETGEREILRRNKRMSCWSVYSARNVGCSCCQV